MQKSLVLLALITLVAGVTFAQTEVQSRRRSYIFQSIDFPNATTTQVFGINERGDIVGSYVDASGTTHGFSLINVRFATVDFPGSILTQARGINDGGTIVGGFTRADDPNGAHGFVLHGKRYKQVDFPGSAHSGVLGVNEAADLTGSYDLGDINTGIGFFTKNGKFVSFEVPGSAPQMTGPHGINDSGQVTGFFQDSIDSNITLPSSSSEGCLPPSITPERPSLGSLALTNVGMRSEVAPASTVRVTAYCSQAMSLPSSITREPIIPGLAESMIVGRSSAFTMRRAPHTDSSRLRRMNDEIAIRGENRKMASPARAIRYWQTSLFPSIR